MVPPEYNSAKVSDPGALRSSSSRPFFQFSIRERISVDAPSIFANLRRSRAVPLSCIIFSIISSVSIFSHSSPGFRNTFMGTIRRISDRISQIPASIECLRVSSLAKSTTKNAAERRSLSGETSSGCSECNLPLTGSYFASLKELHMEVEELMLLRDAAEVIVRDDRVVFGAAVNSGVDGESCFILLEALRKEAAEIDTLRAASASAALIGVKQRELLEMVEGTVGSSVQSFSDASAVVRARNDLLSRLDDFDTVVVQCSDDLPVQSARRVLDEARRWLDDCSTNASEEQIATVRDDLETKMCVSGVSLKLELLTMASRERYQDELNAFTKWMTATKFATGSGQPLDVHSRNILADALSLERSWASDATNITQRRPVFEYRTEMLKMLRGGNDRSRRRGIIEHLTTRAVQLRHRFPSTMQCLAQRHEATRTAASVLSRLESDEERLTPADLDELLSAMIYSERFGTNPGAVVRCRNSLYRRIDQLRSHLRTHDSVESTELLTTLSRAEEWLVATPEAAMHDVLQKGVELGLVVAQSGIHLPSHEHDCDDL